jgi:hypothetical protein
MPSVGGPSPDNNLVANGTIFTIAMVLIFGGGMCFVIYKLKKAAQALFAAENSDDDEFAKQDASSRTLKIKAKAPQLSQEEKNAREQLQLQAQAQERAQAALGRAHRRSMSIHARDKGGWCGNIGVGGWLATFRAWGVSDRPLRGDALVRPLPTSFPTSFSHTQGHA